MEQPVASADRIFRADLHTHTCFSDGSLSPEELLLLAKESGLSGLSITDHDTLGAYERALPVAREQGIALGSGVEFSCQFRTLNVHLLGYGFSLQEGGLQEFCRLQQQRRVERNASILKKLAAHRMPLQQEEVEHEAPFSLSLGRPHIAKAMVRKGYVSSLQEAFDLYIGDQRSCYSGGEECPVLEAIEAIHRAGGKAFLAHPHLLRRSSLVDALLGLPLDGIECYYARALPGQERKWLLLAKKRGWLISGGSDFHGAFKPHIPLGCSWVDRKVFERIFPSLLCSNWIAVG